MDMARRFRGILAGLLIAVVAGCSASTPPIGPADLALVGTPLEGCCRETEVYAPVLIALIEPFAPLLGNAVGASVFRSGYLADERVQAQVLQVVRPLDVVLLSNKHRASGSTIPGLFGHLAVYLGSEAELRALGMWNHATVVPHQAEIRAGMTFIESDRLGVHLSLPEEILNTDRVVLARPQLASNARRREVVAGFAQRLGMKFDYHFDNATPDELYCAELVSIVMPELRLPTRIIYGRETILPDDVAAQASTGRIPLAVAAYFRGKPEVWERSDRAGLITDLADWWQRGRNEKPAAGAPGV